MDLNDWLLVAANDPDPTVALAIAADDLEEQGQNDESEFLRQEVNVLKFPGKVGESWLICTVTLYYVGRIAENGLGFVRLEDASWVHWTGRLSTLLSVQKFRDKDFGTRTPRVEPCGKNGQQIAIIATNSIVSAYPWSGELPKEPV